MWFDVFLGVLLVHLLVHELPIIVCVVAVFLIKRFRKHHSRDACQRCHGVSGGVPGNENIVDGEILCDHCTMMRKGY